MWLLLGNRITWHINTCMGEDTGAVGVVWGARKCEHIWSHITMVTCCGNEWSSTGLWTSLFLPVNLPSLKLTKPFFKNVHSLCHAIQNLFLDTVSFQKHLKLVMRKCLEAWFNVSFFLNWNYSLLCILWDTCILEQTIIMVVVVLKIGSDWLPVNWLWFCDNVQSSQQWGWKICKFNIGLGWIFECSVSWKVEEVSNYIALKAS